MWRGDNYNENMLMMTATQARDIFIYENLFFFFFLFWFMSGMKFPVKIQYVFQYGSIFKSTQNIGVSVPN